MSKIWFCSDLHIGHDKEFLWKARGFNSIQEHDKTVIQNFNSLVNDEDDVYILGDLTLGPTPDQSFAYLSKLKGNIHIIVGNHDTVNKINKYYEILGIQSIDYAKVIKYKKYAFYLSHYPTLCANYGDDKPLWNIHGHTHSTEKFSDFAQCYNVALDAHNCFPIEIEDILQDIRLKKEELRNEV